MVLTNRNITGIKNKSENRLCNEPVLRNNSTFIKKFFFDKDFLNQIYYFCNNLLTTLKKINFISYESHL